MWRNIADAIIATGIRECSETIIKNDVSREHNIDACCNYIKKFVLSQLIKMNVIVSNYDTYCDHCTEYNSGFMTLLNHLIGDSIEGYHAKIFANDAVCKSLHNLISLQYDCVQQMTVCDDDTESQISATVRDFICSVNIATPFVKFDDDKIAICEGIPYRIAIDHYNNEICTQLSYHLVSIVGYGFEGMCIKYSLDNLDNSNTNIDLQIGTSVFKNNIIVKIYYDGITNDYIVMNDIADLMGGVDAMNEIFINSEYVSCYCKSNDYDVCTKTPCIVHRSHFLIMPEGIPLSKSATDIPFKYVYEIINMVTRLHQKGIFFTDLKKSNMIIVDNKLKFIDYTSFYYSGTTRKPTFSFVDVLQKCFKKELWEGRRQIFNDSDELLYERVIIVMFSLTVLEMYEYDVNDILVQDFPKVWTEFVTNKYGKYVTGERDINALKNMLQYMPSQIPRLSIVHEINSRTLKLHAH